MNDKIKSLNFRFSEIMTTRVGGKTKSDTLIAIGKYSQGQDSTRKDVLRISFHERILKLTGWVVGDRVDLEIKDGIGHIFRNTKGVKIYRGGNQSTRTIVRFMLPAGTLDGLPVGEAREVETQPGHVAFMLPQEEE